jgi:threonine dehydrogenase-like Zn-dependent dehydrogenase
LLGTDGDDAEIGGGFGTLPGVEQFNGGQASFVRVPFASDNLLLLPAGKEHELDYVLLADIFPDGESWLKGQSIKSGIVPPR